MRIIANQRTSRQRCETLGPRERSRNASCGGSKPVKPLWRVVSCLQWPVIALLLTMPQASIPVALAQDYPSRPIALIVPLTAGGGADTLGRILAERMKGTLGQPIVIENIPTASGTVGVGRLAQAAPDGYTIGIGYQTTN